MIIKVDPHTHTIYSGHAFSTIEENAIHAAEKGLEAIGMTDHFGLDFCMSGNHSLEFGASMNMRSLPKYIHNVRILAGTEVDIVDFEGNLAGHDIPYYFNKEKSICRHLLDTREIAIASVHYFKGCRDGTVAQNTSLYCKVAENPDINIIGHCGRSGLPFDIDTVLSAAKENNTLIEINEHSFNFGEDVAIACRKIAERCGEQEVDIVVSSDAHSAFFVGGFSRAVAMLEEISFPQELIANLTLEKLMKKINA